MSQESAPREHPERALMRDVIANGKRDVPVTTNPLAELVRMHIVEASETSVRCAFHLDERFAQGNGVVQGGIVAALLDFGMAFAAFAQIPAGMTIATAAQTTNFLAAAAVGELTVEATLDKVGRTMIHARASLFSPQQRLLATATAPIVVVPLR